MFLYPLIVFRTHPALLLDYFKTWTGGGELEEISAYQIWICTSARKDNIKVDPTETAKM